MACTRRRYAVQQTSSYQKGERRHSDLAIAILVGIGILAPPGFEFIGPHVWLGTLWYLLLTILAVKEVERLSCGRSIGLALMGFVVNGVVQFIFIR